MTEPAELPANAGTKVAAQIQADVAALERELAEIEMLVGQARAEAGRHEQKRAAAADRLSGQTEASADAFNQLVTLTRRAVLMESQVELLEAKHKALARQRDALTAVVEALEAGSSAADTEQPMPADADAGAVHESLPPNVSRMVLNVQEDLRREIARSMHDGPAQSLTNIVLQAQIVARLVERDPSQAQEGLRQLISMVQQTLDATKNFIFDVRPMVLDDLGLVPTLRRSARDRGRRESIPVGFDSLGQDQRLPMDVETTAFRIVDEALTAYLRLRPDRMMLTLDWTDVLEVRLVAERAAQRTEASEPLPDIPTGDVPDAIRQMIQERHDAWQAAIDAAEAAAIVVLPDATARDVAARAGSIGATLELLGGGCELRLVIPLPSEIAGEGAAAATDATADATDDAGAGEE